jgi:hypothetical protein
VDRIDLASFVFTSAVISYLTDISGLQLVCAQAVWLGVLYIGKRVVDIRIERRS